MNTKATDVIVQGTFGGKLSEEGCKNLDATFTALPGITVQLIGGPNGPFKSMNGGHVARVFGSVEMFKFMVENQGYCKVTEVLEELS